jgi:hypothetical protein
MDHYLNPADDDARDETLRRTRDLLQWNPAVPRPRKELSDKTLRLLANREEQRRDAVSEYWAKHASRLPEVKSFRQEVLADRLLSSDEAQDFLISPGALMFSAEDLASRRIDPARHRATVTEEQAQYLGPYRAVVVVESPHAELEFKRSSTPTNVWDGERPRGDDQLFVRVEGRTVVEAQPWYGSAVHALAQASAAVDSAKYPWRKGDAGWFILTGEVPKVPAIGYSFDWTMGSRGTRVVIDMQVEPWISVDRVADLYKRLQNETLGGRNRPISDRRISLFRFATNATNDNGEVPPWRELMIEWNNQFPKWTYDNVRNFSRDYWAGARGLIFPKYRLFWSVEENHGKARKR